MNKEFFIRNKKVFLISFAVLFIVIIFFLKSNSAFKNSSSIQTGLVYSNETLNDLVNQDTDGDGVLDWEEGLWGTDPKKIDSNDDGIGDAAEISKMKIASGKTDSSPAGAEEKLTETDKFSRELFTTVTALTQTGGLDQNTIDKLNASLVQQISNPVIKRTFTSADIKTTKDNSLQSVKAYNEALNTIFKRSPSLFQEGYEGVTYEIGKRFVSAMEAFANDPDADVSVVSNLDSVTKETQILKDGMAKMITPVPEELSVPHLAVINAFQRILENLNDLKLVESDPILAMGGASKFSENMDALQTAITKLRTAVDNKLKN